MTKLRFETVIVHGDDRGSVRRVNAYILEVPAKEHASRLDTLGAAFAAAMEQVTADSCDGQDDWVYLENTKYFEKMTDETELMRMAYRSSDPDHAEVAGSDKVIVKRLVKDMLASEDWQWSPMNAAEGDDLVSPTVAFKSIDWTAVWDAWKVKVAPAPVRIPVGTLVYSPTVYTKPGDPYSVFVYHGRTIEKTSYFQNGGFYGEEENFVPVDFVNAQNYAVESFPLPQRFSNKYVRWFARSKQDITVESVTRLKKDAVHNVKVLLAIRDFWSE